MMNRSIFLAAGAALSFFLSSYLPIQTDTYSGGTISVTGDAAVKVPPDEVIITLGVESWHPELSTAKKRNDARVEDIIATAHRYNIPDKDIQTDHISIEPRYRDSYYREDLEGYFVRRTLALTLADISKFDDLLTEVIEDGANYVHGIEFRTTDLRKHRDQARSLAITAAREKAEALSKELGRQVGEPQSIQENHSGWWSGYGSGWWGSHWSGAQTQNVVQSIDVDSALVQGSIAPGQIMVNAQVSVTFSLK
ncbi:MAG: SIMPL domain-containing protein [Anaerolineales bacterium]